MHRKTLLIYQDAFKEDFHEASLSIMQGNYHENNFMNNYTSDLK